jgi:hypothetical protein
MGGDEYERFGYFCRAVLNSLPLINFQPDVIHAHDWQSGMVPALLKIQYAHFPFYTNIRTMFTIHNLQYQGIFGIKEVQDVLGLGDSLWTNDKLECFGCANFLKAALVYADLITTVSPSYAEEIQTAYYGERLDGLLRARKHQLYGVINGLPFFCTCGMGFDAFISLKFAEAGKRGPITYVENVLKEGLNYRPETYEVEDEMGAKRYKAFLIACANASQYGNNAYIAPGATMKDGMMDVIIMEPFDTLEAPQIAADLFMKTLTNNSKIKTFRTKSLRIHRETEGAIHYDGDPIMTGKDVDVHIEHMGIKIVTNPEAIEDDSQPNFLLNAFSDFFNNINNVREDIGRRGHRFQIINKVMLRKLSKL